MKRSYIFLFLLFVIVLTSSLIVSASLIQCVNHECAIHPVIGGPCILPLSFVGKVAYSDRPPPLNQTTRLEVYNFVVSHPGIHFRGISYLLGLPIGVIQYHLDVLVKGGILTVFRDGRYRRFFQSRKYSKREMTVISLLRRETSGKILSKLVQEQISHNDLSSHLGISSQALTWQIKRLMEAKLVKLITAGIQNSYVLDETNASLIERCVSHLSNSVG